MRRVKAFVIVQALLASSLIFSGWKPVETTAEAKLFWDEQNSLGWTDFKNVQRNTDDAAMSSIAIETNCVFDRNNAYIRVRASFNKQKSWVRNGCKTAYILNHEQMHYNIVEIFARKLRKEISETMFTRSTFKDDYNALFDRITAEHEMYQEQYDTETNHSILQDEQTLWNNKVQEELDALEEYSSPLVKVQFAN